MQTLKKWSADLIVFELLLSWQESTKKVPARLSIKHSTWRKCVRKWCQSFSNSSKTNHGSVKAFLTKNSISVLDPPPYSPDVALCDFYLFTKVKSRRWWQDFRLWNRKRKRGEPSQWADRRISSIPLYSERFGWSIAGITEMTILKTIKFMI